MSALISASSQHRAARSRKSPVTVNIPVPPSPATPLRQSERGIKVQLRRRVLAREEKLTATRASLRRSSAAPSRTARRYPGARRQHVKSRTQSSGDGAFMSPGRRGHLCTGNYYLNVNSGRLVSLGKTQVFRAKLNWLMSTRHG